jgi:C_GCAxxG_C_C family probable redox protein
MDKAKAAHDMLAEHKGNCPKSVLTAICEDYGLEKDTAYNLTQGFGGGMSIDSACGAVMGAYMIIGLANPSANVDPQKNREKINTLKAEFNKKFKELHGGLTCTELLGYNLSIPEQSIEAREKGLFTSKCPVFVSDAVKIVEKLLSK